MSNPLLMQNDYQCVASYALFRTLYNRKKDIRDVLGAFILQAILQNEFSHYTLIQLEELLKRDFDISVPIPVIKFACKRLIETTHLRRIGDGYKITDKTHEDKAFKVEYNKIESIQVLLEERVIKFVIHESGGEFTTESRSQIIKALYSSLLGAPSSDTGLDILVNAFIIKNSDDELINKIREGMVLFFGLRDTKELQDSDIGLLCLYFDSDVLFDIAGLNGSQYMSSVNTLLQYIDEINNKPMSKKKQQKIRLLYFPWTRARIDNFFNRTKKNYESNYEVQPNSNAEKAILLKATSLADIEDEKTRFFARLEQKGIVEETMVEDVTSSVNMRFNLQSEEDAAFISKFQNNGYSEDHIYKLFNSMNQISIKRKLAKNESILNSKYIYITRKNIARDIDAWLRRNSAANTPLSRDVDSVVVTIWYKLGKGFGSDTFPTCLGAFAKAEKVVSNIIRTRVSEEYDRIIEKVNKGEIEPDELPKLKAGLSDALVQSNDVTEDSIDSVVDKLTSSDLKGFRDKYDAIERESIKTQRQIEKKNALLQSFDETTNNTLSSISKIRDNKQKHILELTQKIVQVERSIATINKTCMYVIAFITVLVLIIAAIHILKQYDKLEPIFEVFSFFIPLIITICLFTIPKIKRLPVNLAQKMSEVLFRNLYKRKRELKDQINRTEDEENELKRVIEEMKKPVSA